MLRIRLQNETETKTVDHFAGAFEVGRGPERDCPRLMVESDLTVSRDHLRLEELSTGRLRLENLSTRNPVQASDSIIIPVGAVRELLLPTRIRVGSTTIDIEAVHPKLTDMDTDW